MSSCTKSTIYDNGTISVTSGSASSLISMKSNRTVTRDMRQSEFKILTKRHEDTNLHLSEIAKLLAIKLRLDHPGVDLDI